MLRTKVVFTLALLIAFTLAAPLLSAQSLTTGVVAGTVTDPSGAVVPGATVTLRNNDQGTTQTRTTTSTGAYRFPLVPPGSYTLTFTSPNMQTTQRNVRVAVGQATTTNVQMALEAAAQTVTVTAEGPVIQTATPSISTNMSNEQVSLVPNGGGDLSYLAQTAPGSVMNTQAGLGNFSSFGLPALYNNFTMNSAPENDPFLNLNNSGATNILLGQNDVSEATVVSNGYSGQYSFAGANVNYVSKAGSNAFHGNASWMWNGRYVNANNFFNKQASPKTPRPFVNDNMWQASFGGPISKDKTFFFVDTEGLYLLIPVNATANIPSPGWASAVQSHIATVSPASSSLYSTMLKTWRNAPNAAGATNTLPDGGCADFAGKLGFGAANPCALALHTTVTGNTHEWLIAGRVDHNFSDKDKMFIHARVDRGVQASYVDPINPIFNVTSFQPQYEGQLSETHTFGPNTVNSFYLNGSYYRAIFSNPKQADALAQQPTQIAFVGGSTFSGLLYGLGDGYQFPFPTPQGRNVTQYGFVDDISHTMGKHTVKIGANFARYDITDFAPGRNSLPAVFGETMTDFFNGIASNFRQAFPTRSTQPVNLYNLGFYGEDSWHVRPNLTLTLTIRADRFSNPGCVTNCFSRFVEDFSSINHNLTTPYNQTVLANQGNAFSGSYHPWTVQPRFGFNYALAPDTIISGGFGLFSSPFPAANVEPLINNLPGNPTFTLSGVPFAPGAPGNALSSSAAAAAALRTGFFAGQSWAAINAALLNATGGATGFIVPNFTNVTRDLHNPRVQAWNLQVQHSFGTKTALNLKYVGNHGIWQQISNSGLNAFCGTTAQLPLTAATGRAGCLETLGVSSFAGLPASPADPRFSVVTENSTGYNSNYNGLTVSLLRRLSSFQFQINYTYSHALDFSSNSGTPGEYFNFNTNASILSPQNPFNVKQNMYGNADYDVRHYLSLNYVYTTPKNLLHGFVGGALAGWTISGTVFTRSGLPFTVIDSGTGSTLHAYNYGGTNPNTFGTFANQTGRGTLSCGSSSAFGDKPPCSALTNNFVSDPTSFGNQRRNQVSGPTFFNTDLSIAKQFHVPHWEAGVLSIGATAFNLLNHPNFDQPIGDVASDLGRIVLTVNSPTSIYGSGLGADASPRVFQSQIKLTF